MSGEDQIDDVYGHGLELIDDMVAMSNAAETIFRSSTTEKQETAFEDITVEGTPKMAHPF